MVSLLAIQGISFSDEMFKLKTVWFFFFSQQQMLSCIVEDKIGVKCLLVIKCCSLLPHTLKQVYTTFQMVKTWVGRVNFFASVPVCVRFPVCLPLHQPVVSTVSSFPTRENCNSSMSEQLPTPVSTLNHFPIHCLHGPITQHPHRLFVEEPTLREWTRPGRTGACKQHHLT